MQEKIAKTKWCPFSRVAFINIDSSTGEESGFSYNRSNDIKDKLEAKCITTECMLWKTTGQNEGRCGLIK